MQNSSKNLNEAARAITAYLLNKKYLMTNKPLRYPAVQLYNIIMSSPDGTQTFHTTINFEYPFQ